MSEEKNQNEIEEVTNEDEHKRSEEHTSELQSH